MKKISSILATVVVLSGSAFASDVAVGVKAGTLGPGVDLTFGLTKNFNLRLNGNYFGYSKGATVGDVRYDADLTLATGGVLADWYPFSNGLRLSGGVYYNGNKLEGTGKASSVNGVKSVKLNGTTYAASDLGSLSIDGDLGNPVAPYVGIGWGNPLDKEGRWTFTVDVGVLFTGSPDVTASVNGPLKNNSDVKSDLNAEVKKVNDKVDYPVYPVVALGVSYKF
jgi:hypothetical protein